MDNVSLASFTPLELSTNFSSEIISLLSPSTSFSNSTVVFSFVNKHHLISPFLIISLAEIPIQSLTYFSALFTMNLSKELLLIFILISSNPITCSSCISVPLLHWMDTWEFSFIFSKYCSSIILVLGISRGFPIINFLDYPPKHTF